MPTWMRDPPFIICQPGETRCLLRGANCCIADSLVPVVGRIAAQGKQWGFALIGVGNLTRQAHLPMGAWFPHCSPGETQDANCCIAGSLVLGRIAARNGQSGLALAAASTCCIFAPHNGTTMFCVALVPKFSGRNPHPPQKNI